MRNWATVFVEPLAACTAPEEMLAPYAPKSARRWIREMEEIGDRISSSWGAICDGGLESRPQRFRLERLLQDHHRFHMAQKAR
jgi:hypothetical protein